METTSSWRLALASAIGTSHVASGSTCQDRAAHAFLTGIEGPVLVLAVADGAGSAAHSEIGSWLATKTLLERIEAYLDDGGRLADLDRPVALAWLEEVAQALENHAAAVGDAVRDYACTLLAAIVGEGHTAFFQIGDGAIVVSDGQDDGWSYVFWPQHGEFANTTNFVLSANASEALEFELAPRGVPELALFSDGIEKLVLHDATRSVHEGFFNKMFLPVRRLEQPGLDENLSAELERYLSSPLICERTDDDKTLVLASRMASGGE